MSNTHTKTDLLTYLRDSRKDSKLAEEYNDHNEKLLTLIQKIFISDKTQIVLNGIKLFKQKQELNQNMKKNFDNKDITENEKMNNELCEIEQQIQINNAKLKNETNQSFVLSKIFEAINLMQDEYKKFSEQDKEKLQNFSRKILFYKYKTIDPELIALEKKIYETGAQSIDQEETFSKIQKKEIKNLLYFFQRPLCFFAKIDDNKKKIDNNEKTQDALDPLNEFYEAQNINLHPYRLYKIYINLNTEEKNKLYENNKNIIDKIEKEKKLIQISNKDFRQEIFLLLNLLRENFQMQDNLKKLELSFDSAGDDKILNNMSDDLTIKIFTKVKIPNLGFNFQNWSKNIKDINIDQMYQDLVTKNQKNPPNLAFIIYNQKNFLLLDSIYDADKTLNLIYQIGGVELCKKYTMMNFEKLRFLVFYHIFEILNYTNQFAQENKLNSKEIFENFFSLSVSDFKACFENSKTPQDLFAKLEEKNIEKPDDINKYIALKILAFVIQKNSANSNMESEIDNFDNEYIDYTSTLELEKDLFDFKRSLNNDMRKILAPSSTNFVLNNINYLQKILEHSINQLEAQKK